MWHYFQHKQVKILLLVLNYMIRSVGNVKCPYVLQKYNRHMDRVKVMDSYRIKLKRKKWCYLFDLGMIKSWFLYKLILTLHGKHLKVPSKNILSNEEGQVILWRKLLKLNSKEAIQNMYIQIKWIMHLRVKIYWKLRSKWW